jgi:prevent-host-death family protein
MSYEFKRHLNIRGNNMQKSIGVAEVKRHFSEILNDVSIDGKHFIIERKGKPVAAMVSVKDLELIKERIKEKKGLLAALGAWEDFERLDSIIEDIYRKRERARDRKVKVGDVSF